MATDKSMAEMFGTVMKDVVSALRDSVLFFLFVLLLFQPEVMKDRLAAAGFTKGTIAGFEWEAQIKSAAEQTKTVGQTVGQANENYDRLIERLSELESNVTDPSVKATVKNIGAAAATSRAELVVADQALKRSLAMQQQVVAQIAPSAVADSGWIFLGKVTEDKTAWTSGSPQTVNSTTAQISSGTRLTVRDDAYLRADGPSNARSSAAVVGVAKVGETVQVQDLDYSHASGGGWFVWAKVKRS